GGAGGQSPTLVRTLQRIRVHRDKSKTPRDTDEWIDVVSRAGDADVDSRIEPNVARQRPGQPDVERADPVGAGLRADRAPKFDIAGDVAADVVAKGDGLRKLRVMAAGGRVAVHI